MSGKPPATAGGGKPRTARSRPGTSGRHVNEPAFIVAAIANKGLEVGCAAMNLKSPELILSQYTDTQTFGNSLSLFQLYDPVEILLPSTMEKSQLREFAKNLFPMTHVQLIARKFFDESKGFRQLKELVTKETHTFEQDMGSK
jgi:DNA mismatch repair protein MSH4